MFLAALERGSRGATSTTDLSAFERRTLELFASGLPRREIAEILNRAPKTISNSLTSAKEKLGARSLAEAAALLAAEAMFVASRTGT
jgi:DNA-binding CsgD family transcriptional regulator